MHTIEDLVASAIGQRPIDFEQSFTALMREKTADAIEARKAELAKTLFNQPAEKETEE